MDETKEKIRSLTTKELHQAILDLDNEKYSEEKFTTNEEGYKYNFVSPLGRYYGAKRIAECALLNRGFVCNYNEFLSSSSLRNKIIRTGYEMVESNSLYV